MKSWERLINGPFEWSVLLTDWRRRRLGSDLQVLKPCGSVGVLKHSTWTVGSEFSTSSAARGRNGINFMRHAKYHNVQRSCKWISYGTMSARDHQLQRTNLSSEQGTLILSEPVKSSSRSNGSARGQGMHS